MKRIQATFDKVPDGHLFEMNGSGPHLKIKEITYFDIMDHPVRANAADFNGNLFLVYPITREVLWLKSDD